MSRGAGTSSVFERWNDTEIHVDHNGVFFIRDKQGHRILEAKTAEALKAKVRKPTSHDIQAVMFGERRYWRRDELPEWDNWSRVHVYAISGLGTVLYESTDGAKHRASDYEKVYVFDQQRLDTRARLLKEKDKAEKELAVLMEDWPQVKPGENEPANRGTA